MSYQSETNSKLNIAWGMHRDYLRRLLISLTHDLDLAEDLLQDTYLQACQGWENFRGGDAWAWLSTIARNIFYSHCRKRYVRMETPLDIEIAQPFPQYDEHLLAEVRQSITNLPAKLRTALIMKHYGGFSYLEIAERQQCPVGTAKWQVSSAIKQLKTMLGIKKEMEMVCSWRSIQLLDYLYGALPLDESNKFEQHLIGCAHCREEIDGLKPLLQALDVATGEYKAMKTVDLDEHGMPTEYDWADIINDTTTTRTQSWWMVDKNICVDYMMFQQQEVTMEKLPGNERQYKYLASLPQPVAPGESYQSLLVTHQVDSARWATRIAENHWCFRVETSPNTSKEWAYMLTVRLPVNAQLMTAEPSPTELLTIGARAVLIWRTLLLPGSHPQFKCIVEYRYP